MFGHRFFGARYFGPSYFGPDDGEVASGFWTIQTGDDIDWTEQ